MNKIADVGCSKVLPFILLGLFAPMAFAQAPAPKPTAAPTAAPATAPAPATIADPALTWTHDDPKLTWRPCPPFLPKGCGIAVLRGDPAKPNVDVFFKVPGKSIIPLHWHSSPERMVLVAGELHVTYDGQKMAVLKPGTYAYGPAKRPHKAVCTSSVPCVLFIGFESPLDAVPVESAKK